MYLHKVCQKRACVAKRVIVLPALECRYRRALHGGVPTPARADEGEEEAADEARSGAGGRWLNVLGIAGQAGRWRIVRAPSRTSRAWVIYWQGAGWSAYTSVDLFTG